MERALEPGAKSTFRQEHNIITTFSHNLSRNFAKLGSATCNMDARLNKTCASIDKSMRYTIQ
jgi:hypothetical protein